MVNELLSKKYDGREAGFTYKEIATEWKKQNPDTDFNDETAYNHHWVIISDNFPGSFIFRPKIKKGK